MEQIRVMSQVMHRKLLFSLCLVSLFRIYLFCGGRWHSSLKVVGKMISSSP